MHANWKWLMGAVLCACAAVAAAQYPARPIHIVVPSAPGDGSDLTARLIGDKLAAVLGQPLIVDNKLGAGGVVGTEFAARQPADGYTLIMANAGSHAINAARKLRALAVTTVKRYPGLPEVPTVAESGLAGFETVAWFGLFAPPKDIVSRLNREVNAIVPQPEVRERLLGLGMEPALGTPEDYTARQAADIAKWKKVVAESGAKID